MDPKRSVRCDTRFFSVEEQVAAIQSCHVGVFAYQDHSQSSSGTMPLVMSVGRPVVCTPFEYAQSKSEEGLAAIIADGFGHEDVADAIERMWGLGRPGDLAVETYRRTSNWAWAKIGTRFEGQFELAAGEIGGGPSCGGEDGVPAA